MLSGTAIGLPPPEVFRLTLPELLLAVRGKSQVRRGGPGARMPSKPMSKQRLLELHERYA